MNEWTASKPLREAQQEEMNGNASYGNRNRKAYEREYGPFATEEEYLASVGEIIESEIY
jgi:hypothetical protein